MTRKRGLTDIVTQTTKKVRYCLKGTEGIDCTGENIETQACNPGTSDGSLICLMFYSADHNSRGDRCPILRFYTSHFNLL